MMLKSKNEVIMVCVLLIVIAGAGYYFLFFSSYNDNMQNMQIAIDERKMEVEEAERRKTEYEAKQERLRSLQNEWASLDRPHFNYFDDAVVLNHIQEIVYPYTKKVRVTFEYDFEDATERNREREVTRIHKAIVEFNQPYEELVEILEAFEENNIYSRVIDYNVKRMNNAVFKDNALETFITAHINNRANPFGDEKFPYDVRLQVEYLTRK